MKLLLLSVFCFVSFSLFAQIPKNKNPWMIPLPDTLLKKFKGNNNEVLRKQFQEYLQRKQQQNQMFADKHGNVAFLPQDHMPCVVPDTNGISPMPNAWSGVTTPFRPQYHPIPNPALPPQSFKYNALDNSIGIPSK